MANELKFNNKVVFVGGFPLTVTTRTSDPGSAVAGDLYFNTSTQKLKIYNGSVWQDLTTGTVSLTGQTLNDGEIIVGNASNLSAAVDTDTTGDILADHTTALTIKSGVITNTHVNAAADIAYSKLANLGAATNRLLVANASDKVSAHASILSSDLILKDGSVPFTAAQSMGGFRLTNLATPTSSTDATTKAYVDALVQGLDTKGSVRAATTANITLSGEQTIDGIAIVTGDRVLVKNQSAAANNGIYIADSGAWTRATDMDTWAKVVSAYTFIEEGTTNADRGFVCTSDQGGTLGVTDIVWTQFSSAGSIVDGAALSFSGNILNVNVAAAGGIEIQSDALQVRIDGSTLSSSASGLKVADASLTNTQIASGAAIAYSKLNLTGSIVNADINASAAIAYSKLNLTGSITNADIAAAAAIAYDKLAALTADRALVSNGSGFVSASAVSAAELGYLSGVTSSIQTQLAGKANTSLNNLGSVAINTSLISDTNNTDDLGTDAIEWKDVWAHRLAHNDASNPNLNVETTGNNGSVVATAHGTGNFDVKATKIRQSESGASTNFVEDQYFDGLALAANTSSATAISSLSFATASFRGCMIEYTIREATSDKQRIGHMTISTDGTVSSATDQYAETDTLGSALGLTLDAAVNGANVEVRYNNTHATNAATMRCRITRFRA